MDTYTEYSYNKRMEHTTPAVTTRRRRVTLTIRADLMTEAKALNLNASRAAEAGIEQAGKRAKETAWLADNAAAIAAYNERIARDGLTLVPGWATK